MNHSTVNNNVKSYIPLCPTNVENDVAVCVKNLIQLR